jgi:hypothetical protein
MPRVNRFRAWDKKEKQFVYFELYDGVNNHTPPIYPWADLEPWQQFLGLKDKIGKEIYEGDIVEWDSLHDNGFRESGGHNREKIVYQEGEWCLGDFMTFASESRYHEFKVVGDIYENPEPVNNSQK